jgi:SAM-dependent methyltransferase
MEKELDKLFTSKIIIQDNIILFKDQQVHLSKNQTNEIFTEKWLKNDIKTTLDGIQKFQLDWYLKLYGFETEEKLKKFLKTKRIILDAGCGLGYKAAWFAQLSPQSIVIGIDFSDAVFEAARYYKNIRNLFFVKGNITDTQMKLGKINYISCDQVIHHTSFPEKTFAHLSERLSIDGEFACYVYSKKALPRELLDNYFRTHASEFTKEEIWQLSEQLTTLGKTLSGLNIHIDVPDIPLLGIKGGDYDIQRFIYWNFMKCFWNEQFGWKNSVLTNFDWYGPANATRYSEEEFKGWILHNKLKIVYFHKEEACYSGRFLKK